MRVADLYKVLNETISIRIVDNDNGEIFMTGLPFFIPVGIMDCRLYNRQWNKIGVYHPNQKRSD